MDLAMPTYNDIQERLTAHQPVFLSDGFRTRAAVALILRSSPAGAEVLFIERAAHAGDPWSGDLGFPGGKVETDDRDARLAAERETREEIGLDLGGARYLGRLSDIAGAHLPVSVSCFVYGLTGPARFQLGDEVRTTFWTSLAQLCNPERHIEAAVRFDGSTLLRPAIRLLEPGQTVLWGITYRLVIQFLGILGCP
jgi:8-oxo-dGTP pyrophosphatase MutT (NUDIX family)